MIWYDHMFLGKGCRRNAARLKEKISGRQMHAGVYLIVLAESGHALLEIIPSVVLLQKYYPADNLRVVGMAATRREAFSLVETILGEAYQNCGNLNEVASYLEQYR